MSARSLGANPYRGEARFEVGGGTVVLRPSFAALIAAEEELGSLFEIVERAAEGQLRLTEIVALFDHLSRCRPDAVTRERIGEAVVDQGLAAVTPVLRTILAQILQGR